MIHDAISYDRCVIDVKTGELDRAINMYALAWMFDEKAVPRDLRVCVKTGHVEIGHDFERRVVQQANLRFASDHCDIFAVVTLQALDVMPGADRSFDRRFELAQAALDALNSEAASSSLRNIRPWALHQRGCLHAFRKDMHAAKRDFEEALRLLRLEPATSMWPADPRGLTAEANAKIRQIMRASVELDVGRCSM